MKGRGGVTARFAVEGRETVQMSLTLTMPLKDWRVFRQRLTSGYPEWAVAGAISEMIAAAEREMMVDIEEDGE